MLTIARAFMIVLSFVMPTTVAGVLAQTKTEPAGVSKDVEGRTGHPLHPGTKTTTLMLPEGVSLKDGVTEDEAVAIALWNNPSLQAELTALGLARADVIQAGLLANPQLTMIFPFSFRILEAVANWPIEAFWQRPRRVAAAKLEQERVGETLVGRALDLVRDVRLAYADYSAANIRADIAEDIVSERREIAIMVNARLRAGDISELETNAAITDSRQAEERGARFTQEAALASERLRGLLGFGNDDVRLDFIAPTSQLAPPASRIISVRATVASIGESSNDSNAATESESLNKLIKQALEAAPEVKAGELAIEAAGARAKWERSRILNVTAIAKEYGRGANGFEQGPGLLMDLPIFNRNQGNISRAEAEIERAVKQLIATRQRVVSGVREAYLQLTQAHAAYQLWRTRALLSLEQEIRLAETAYRQGDVSYLFVLETARRYSDERLREADYQVARARALAQLERNVGRRLIVNR
jgi:outer membrane protein, heavy metal efflux system